MIKKNVIKSTHIFTKSIRHVFTQNTNHFSQLNLATLFLNFGLHFVEIWTGQFKESERAVAMIFVRLRIAQF